MLALFPIVFLFGLMPIVLSLPVHISQRDSGSKYVVAHFMVGNAYPYTVNDWSKDIELASSAGIDAFALNIGSDSWQPDRVKDAYTAAQTNGKFKMFISFDMTVLPCASSSDANTLRQYVNQYVSHKAQLMYNGKALFSSFSGGSCQFGAGNVNSGWSSVFGGANTVFVPSFFVDPSQFGSLNGAMDGALNWNSGWPTELTTNAVPQAATNSPQVPSSTLKPYLTSMSSDDQYLSGLGRAPTTQTPNNNGNIYMASVSPWFYTHYGADSYNKNFLYVCDDHLYATRWDNLISKRDHIDLVEILTWNDYGESSYIGPIKGSQPKSQAWVDGFDHQGWLTMTNYYAQAFKTGSYPNPPTEDHVVLWARPHSKNANSGDPVGKPTNWELLSDNLWAWVLLKDTADVVLSTCSSNSKTFSNLSAGLHKLNITLSGNGPLSAQVTRNGQQVLQVQSNGTYSYQDGGSVQTYNFNAFVVSS